MSQSPEDIARTLRARFESGFPKTADGDGLLSPYDWIKLVQDQTGLSFAAADELALQVAPEFTVEYWTAHNT